MVFFNDSIVVAGGVSENGQMNEFILKYDLVAGLWEQLYCDSWRPRSYFGLSVYLDKIYAFPGWVDYKDDYENSVFQISLSDICNCTELSTTLSKDNIVYNYAFSYNSKSSYIFGGYSSSGITNTFLKYSFETSALSIETKSYKSPRKLMNASLVKILEYLYLFGGMYDETRYNELWRYDIKSSLWQRLKSNGDIPSPRSHHAAGVDGDIMIIFGGKDNSIYFNDAYQFNTLTSTWTELKYSGINPSPRFAACLMVKLPIIYIYGGETRSGLSPDIFTYNISDTTYKKWVSKPEFVLGNGQTCFLDAESETFDVIYGLGEGDQPLGYVQRYNFTNMSWEAVFDPDNETYSRCRPVIAKIGRNYIIAGGSTWATKVKREIISISTETKTLNVLGTLDHIAYQAPFVHYKGLLFVYGGGSSYNDLIRYNTATRIFFYLDLKDVCIDDCESICAPGSFYDSASAECESCGKGYYSDYFGAQECTPCVSGTYNNMTGASSQRQCYPCPQGYFNPTPGAINCLSCPSNKICPTGSAGPLENVTKSSLESYQPKPFERSTEKASNIFKYIVITFTISGFFILLGFLVVRKMRNWIVGLDHFTNSHNYKLDVPLISKHTLLGGVFTFLYIVAALIIISNSLIIYSVDNEIESKSLIPLVVLQETIEKISGDIEIEVMLGNYGGDCEDQETGNCVNEIFFMITDIQKDEIKFTCSRKGRTCTLSLKMSQCSIQSTTQIDFSLQEKLSYCSEISTTMSSQSSIPKSRSSVKMSAYPNDQQVFRGSTPTTFTFSLTSSYFSSQITDKKQTGFHVAPSSSPSEGTSYSASDLGFTSDLNVRVIISRSLNALRTERSYSVTPFILILALVGSIPGLKGIFEVCMTFIEKNYLSLKEKMNRNKTITEIEEQRKKNENCFQYNLETTRNDEFVYQSGKATVANG